MLHHSKLAVSLLVVLISIIPADVFATPLAQQGNFKVSVAGTAPGSVTHEIALKVTQIPGGQLSEATGFAITPESVVQVKQGESLIVTTSENLKVNNLKVRNVQGQQVDLIPLPNNIWSLQSQVPGVYLLDVIVDISSSGILGVYETVLVILQPDQTPLPSTSVINQLSIYIETEFSFENDTDQNATEPEPGPAPPSPCYFDPTLEECQPIDGKCPPGFSFNENEQCIPIGKCPDGYGRLDDDETGKCYKISDIKICPDGYITHKNSECPPPYTTPGPTPGPSPEPIPCPLDAQGNEVCPPTDEPTPIPGPPTPQCPEAGPDVCGEDPPPPPEEPPGSNGNGNGNGNDGNDNGNGDDNEGEEGGGTVPPFG